MVFDSKYKAFVVYVISFSFILLIDLSCGPQITNLIAKKAFVKVSIKYADFVDIFFLDLASKLPKHTKINNNIIELVNN